MAAVTDRSSLATCAIGYRAAQFLALDKSILDFPEHGK